MMKDQRKQEAQMIESDRGAGLFEDPEAIKQLAARLETEPFDQITAVTLQQLSRMFERRNGVEIFTGTKTSFEEALSLVAEILVDKTLYERLSESFIYNKELFNRLHFRALEIAGELCEQWAEELISELNILHAEYSKNMRPMQE